MAGIELMLEALKLYEKRADEAYERGQYAAAKQNYLLAADALEKVVKQSAEPLKTERIGRVKRLKDRAAECDAGRPRKIVTETGAGAKVGTGASERQEKDSEEKEEKEKKSFFVIEKPSIRFEDIAGLNDVKEHLKQAMLYPFTYSDLCREYGQKAGGGILLYGLPGTGKTMLARAAASELNAEFFNISGGALKDKYFGESEKNIMQVFDAAREYERVILYFDEFEEIAERKETEGANPAASMTTELLRQMDGFSKNKNTMFFMAATNKPWLCDGALLRPGRFGTKICIPLPDFEARLFLVKKNLKKLPVESSVCAEEMARRFEGASGADIDSEYDGFFGKLKRRMIQKCISLNNGKSMPITAEDIDEVFEGFTSSILKSDIEKLSEYEKDLQKR